MKKYNSRELARYCDQPCAIEGRLNYKKCSNGGGYRNQSVFKERWFRLVNNYLYYFKISEMGKFDTKNPAGVFIMENSSIQLEQGQGIPFSFSISFIDEPEKRHIYAARSEDNVEQWVLKLRECSYEYLRSRLHTLQSKIYSITGKDPLLHVPRNEGARLWAPSVPFSTVAACTANSSTFSCHLHTHNVFTLERSKSDVQANRPIIPHARSKTKFYTEREQVQDEKKKYCNNFSEEKSKSSALIDQADTKLSDHDNARIYFGLAPSPPVRKKSPINKKTEQPVDTMKGMYLGTTSIMDSPKPVPRRKLSPKTFDSSNIDIVFTDDSKTQSQPNEDLIKF